MTIVLCMRVEWISSCSIQSAKNASRFSLYCEGCFGTHAMYETHIPMSDGVPFRIVPELFLRKNIKGAAMLLEIVNLHVNLWLNGS